MAGARALQVCETAAFGLMRWTLEAVSLDYDCDGTRASSKPSLLQLSTDTG
jgi:hypothetical protein